MFKTANEVYSEDYAGTIVATKREYDNISGFLDLQKSYLRDAYLNLSVNERAQTPQSCFTQNGTLPAL